MDETYIADFKDDDLSSEDELSEPAPKRRRMTRIWIQNAMFDCQEDAEKAVQDEKIWKKSASVKTASGTRIEYRCTSAKYRVRECPAGLYLLYHSTGKNVSLFKTTCEHANHVDDPDRGLPNQLKVFIREKYSEGITKPNAILDLIKKYKLVEPPKPKLVAFLRTLRVEKFGNSMISANELRTWCMERSEIPSDKDTPFVLDYYIKAESCDLEHQDLKIVMSTRRLLALCSKSPLIQADATYKLVWEGFPVLIVGTSDQNNCFHPFAVAVTKGETAEDFSFIFRSLRVYHTDYKPSILLADGSEAITNGFIAVFTEIAVRIMCYFHVIKNIEKYMKPIKICTRVQLKTDISTLQMAANREIFLKAVDLFFCKWKKYSDPRVVDFLTYFREQWIEKNENWFEGAAPGYPSTNNGLESTNSAVKREHTFRERLPLGQFLCVVTEMVEKWSNRRDPSSINCVEFAETPSISLKNWTAAYQWALSNVPVLERPVANDITKYSMNSSKRSTGITQKQLKKYENQNIKTFKEYTDWSTELWNVEVKKTNSDSSAVSTCICPFFQKNRQCKHSLGMLIRLKSVNVPLEAKNLPIGRKRKRGRPSKAKQALLIQ
jgi:hypothetical protein